MECHRLKAFRANLFEVSVWESSGEKHLLLSVCVKPDVRVAMIIHKESAEQKCSEIGWYRDQHRPLSK